MIDLVAVPLRSENRYGVPTVTFQCQSCGGLFMVTPAPSVGDYGQWPGCLDEQCESYEPMRDAALYFGFGMVERRDADSE